jgi:hypothetical protein
VQFAVALAAMALTRMLARPDPAAQSLQFRLVGAVVVLIGLISLVLDFVLPGA